MKFAIRDLNRHRHARPRIRFRQIAEHILGPDYDLSLVFIGPTLSRKLNQTWRGKDKPANILSFPLEPTAGEIFIDLETANGEDLLFLFIHGLLHLKGLEHSSKMEALESQLVKHFQTHESNNRHRARRR